MRAVAQAISSASLHGPRKNQRAWGFCGCRAAADTAKANTGGEVTAICNRPVHRGPGDGTHEQTCRLNWGPSCFPPEAGPWVGRPDRKSISGWGFQTPMFPGLSDTHVPREATRFKPAPRGRSFSVGYLTWADDLILLSITVIADMLSTVSAPHCFRSLTDQAGGGPIELTRRCRGTPLAALVPGQGGRSNRLCVGHWLDTESQTDISMTLSLEERGRLARSPRCHAPCRQDRANRSTSHVK